MSEENSPFRFSSLRMDSRSELGEQFLQWIGARTTKAREGDAHSILQIYAAAMEAAIELERLAEHEATSKIVRELARNRLWWPIAASNSKRVGRAANDNELSDYLASLELGEASPITTRKASGQNEEFSQFVQWIFEWILDRERVEPPIMEVRGADKWIASQEGKEWKKRFRKVLKQLPCGENWAEWLAYQFPEKYQRAERDAKEKHQLSELTQKHLEGFLLNDVARTAYGFLRK